MAVDLLQGMVRNSGYLEGCAMLDRCSTLDCDGWVSLEGHETMTTL